MTGMSREQAARILDPKTTSEALRDYAEDCEARIAAIKEACQMGAAALRRTISPEAWTGCVCNNGKKSCCTCVSMECHFCVGESKYKRGSYCSACGRPLTPEAWDALKKRLRG